MIKNYLLFIALLFLIVTSHLMGQTQPSANIIVTTDSSNYTLYNNQINILYTIENNSDTAMYISECGALTHLIMKYKDNQWTRVGGGYCLAIFIPQAMKLTAHQSYSDNISFTQTGNYKIAFMVTLDSLNSTPDTVSSNEFIIVNSITGIDDQNSKTISEFHLDNNYPNPFNPSTIIRYSIPEDGFITLKVYDLLGREIKTLVNEEKGKGNYQVIFDASSITSGIYFYKLTYGELSAMKQMVIQK